MSKESLHSMNNKMKVLLNEASGISDKCRTKLIKLVEKHFYVDLPNDNYLNVDITILENGNIIMREEEYKTKNKLSSSSDLVNRFLEFQIEAQNLLNKNEINFDIKNRNSELKNLAIILLVILISLVIIIFALRQLLIGDIYGVIWLAFIVGYYILPANGHRLRNRFIRAQKYLRKKFTKK